MESRYHRLVRMYRHPQALKTRGHPGNGSSGAHPPLDDTILSCPGYSERVGQREDAAHMGQESGCLWLQITHHHSGDRAGEAHEHSLVMMQGERLKRCLRGSVIATANRKLDDSFQMSSCCAQLRTGKILKFRAWHSLQHLVSLSTTLGSP